MDSNTLHALLGYIPECRGEGSKIATPFNPPQGVLGPFGPKVGNGVENEFPGPGSKKLKTESKKSRKNVKKELKFRKWENPQKWLGEGAQGLLNRGSAKPLAPAQPGVAPVQNRVAHGARDSWETFAPWFAILELQSPSPPTEPRNPEAPKVHFKVRKMPFWTFRKNGPKSQLKCPKSPFLDILIPNNGLFGHFN